MFDTYTTETQNVTRVNTTSKETIIEQSISPDKVTEMYDKVKSEIAGSYLSKGNLFEIVAIKLVTEPMTMSKIIFVSYVLNGNQFDFEITAQPILHDYESLVKDIESNVLKHLTSILTGKIFRNTDLLRKTN